MKNNLTGFLILLVAAALYLLRFYNVSFADDEQGGMSMIHRILDGGIPYRDIYMHHTPGAFYIQSWIFKLFGKELLISRLTVVTISMFAFILLFFISRKIVSGYFIYVASLSFLFWGVAHHNFFDPMKCALVFGLLQLLVFLRYIENKNKLYLFMSGFLAGMTFLMKQNLGVAVFLYAIASLSCFAFLGGKGLPSRSRIKTVLNESIVLSFGFGFGIVPLVVFFAIQDDPIDLVRCFMDIQQHQTKSLGINVWSLSYLLTPNWDIRLNWFYGLVGLFSIISLYFLFKISYEFINKQGERIRLFSISLLITIIGITFVSEDRTNTVLAFLTLNIGRVFIYIPYVLGVISLLWLIRRWLHGDRLQLIDKKICAITLFVFCYNYVSFTYCANFLMQIFVFPPTYLLVGFWSYKFAGWECHWIGQKNVRIYFLALLFFVFTFMGFWTSYIQYAQQTCIVPITTFNTPLEIPRARGILVTSEGKNIIQSIVRYVKTNTGQDEYIFVFPYDSLFYFLTDRKIPSYYDWFVLGRVPFERQSEVIEDIKEKHVRYVILRDHKSQRFPSREIYPIIDEYLLDNYFTQAAFGNFTVLHKKGDNVQPPYVSEYEKSCFKLQRVNLLNNGNFEDTLETNDTQAVKGWKTANGLTVSVGKKIVKSGSSALALSPNSFSQYLSQGVALPGESEEGRVTFGVWAKGPESPAYIRLRISTSDGHFYETYNISSNWMFYAVHGKVGKKGEAIEVCVFPDDGRNGESFSSIVIDDALLVYGDIPSIYDMSSQSAAP